MDISHVGLLSELIDRIGAPAEIKPALFKCIGEKNLHELTAICNQAGMNSEAIELLKIVVSTTGKPSMVLPRIGKILSGLSAWQSFEQVVRALPYDDMLRIDFSVVDNIHYYNGFVFKGFIDGLPSGVLSGGQYDKLMQKMNRRSGAIGFAVYMDLLERLADTSTEYDVDILLLYDADTPLEAVRAAIESLTGNGNHVMAQRAVPADIRYKQLMKVTNGEVTVLEQHA